MTETTRGSTTGSADPSLITARQILRAALLTPAIGLLVVCTVVPLTMTLWFSLQRYNLQNPLVSGFSGIDNYIFLLGTRTLWMAIYNTVVLVGSVVALTIVVGAPLAVIYDQPFWGRDVARLLVVTPFFIMPAVSALIWKNLLMHPVDGLLAFASRSVGLQVIDWFTRAPLLSIILILSWQWIPFATLVLLAAMQSLDRTLIEAAKIDGAGPANIFSSVILPHLARPISVLILIETMFLLSIFAEILITTSGGPGAATTTITYLVYLKALIQLDIGGASAGAIIAVIVASSAAFFLISATARHIER